MVMIAMRRMAIKEVGEGKVHAPRGAEGWSRGCTNEMQKVGKRIVALQHGTQLCSAVQ